MNVRTFNKAAMNTFHHNFRFKSDKKEYAFQIRTRFPWLLLILAIILAVVAVALIIYIL